MSLNKFLHNLLFFLAIPFVVPTVLVGIAIYAFGVRQRSIADKPIIEVSTTNAGFYTAEYAHAAENYYVLRLYRSKDHSLLAERTYSNSIPAWLIWQDDRLIYTEAWDDWYFYTGEISLPPSLWDKVMTYIP